MQRLILSVILLGLVWAIGLALFISRIPALADGPPPRGDGVVVYTGGGARITAAMTLFSEGGGKRLLISGVHRDTSRTQLAKLWGGAPEQFECCVDLGRKAKTTQGNADELRDWVKTHHFDVVVLVTSDYHLPRALTTTKARVPDIVITPYVVSSGYLDADGRPATVSAWRVIAGEYSKYLLARAKAIAASFG